MFNKMSSRDKTNEEEFNNFMHRVTDVNNIVKKLSSTDEFLNEMGLAEADKYLKTSDASEVIDEKILKLTVKDNKTIINKNTEKIHGNEMSKESFMREVEIDANKRYQDKMVRKEKSETLKVQANKAFRRGEFEKALCLFNKAIEILRDSCVLYTNRALTYLCLNFPEKAVKDCETALKLNEDSLKGWLYKSKCHYLLDECKESQECIDEALNRNPGEKFRIEDYVKTYKISTTS